MWASRSTVCRVHYIKNIIWQIGHDNELLSNCNFRNYITAKWYGFTDAQSSIDHYVVRVGTSPGAGDVLPPTKLPLTDTFLTTDVLLPLEHRIYITVQAYNKVGKTRIYITVRAYNKAGKTKIYITVQAYNKAGKTRIYITLQLTIKLVRQEYT